MDIHSERGVVQKTTMTIADTESKLQNIWL